MRIYEAHICTLSRCNTACVYGRSAAVVAEAELASLPAICWAGFYLLCWR